MENIDTNLLMIVQKLDSRDSVFAFVPDWINELHKHVNRLYVLALYKGEYQLDETIEVFSLGKEKKASRIRYVINLYRTVISLAKKRKINGIFVSQGGWYPLLLWGIKKVYRFKIIQWKTHSKMNIKTYLNFLAADKILTASSAYAAKKMTKITLMGHGIDISRFKIDESIPKADLILVVGRIAPVKRLIETVEIFSRLTSCQQYKHFKLELVGLPTTKSEKSYSYDLAKFIEKKGLSAAIRFRGKVPYHELPRLYNMSKLTLSIGSVGSLDKVIVESMACGVPVVMKTQSIMDQLGKYRRLLCIDEDSTAVDTVKKILDLKTVEYRKMGKELREIVVKNHSLPKLMQRITHEFKVH